MPLFLGFFHVLSGFFRLLFLYRLEIRNPLTAFDKITAIRVTAKRCIYNVLIEYARFKNKEKKQKWRNMRRKKNPPNVYHGRCVYCVYGSPGDSFAPDRMTVVRCYQTTIMNSLSIPSDDGFCRTRCAESIRFSVDFDTPADLLCPYRIYTHKRISNACASDVG